MDSAPFLRFLIAGQLKRDYILLPNGKSGIDIPGGSLMYAAAGLGLWESDTGLIARVGEDYPHEWLERLARQGFDTRGIHILADVMDVRWFAVYTDGAVRQNNNPVAHFSRLGLAFPKMLLGYDEPSLQLDSRTQPNVNTLRLNDFPVDYLDATAAHICPLDYLSHSLLPPAFRQGHVTTISLDPSPGYMNPAFWDDLQVILRGITAFIPSEEKVRSLFQDRSTDLWEMAEAMAGQGCDLIVIQRGNRGQYLYDHARHARWIIPPYPATAVDPTGAGHAFCGGFLAGFRSSYDPVEACIYGGVSASIIAEGTGPFYAFGAFPALIRARVDALREMARRV
jgi:sugar/nucleoside kinase (ribokinase family)